MKTCKKCNTEKPITEFYKNSTCSDGHDSTCKECRCAMARERYKEKRKDPEWVEKERKRSREKYYRLNYREKHDSHSNGNNTHRENYPEKYKANIAAQRMPCPEGCERHHWSYRPIHRKDIIIIDSKVHAYIHRYLEYDQSKMMYRTNEGRLLDTKYKHRVYVEYLLSNIEESDIKMLLGNAA